MHDSLTQDELDHLPDVISVPRFASYLQASGNSREAALELYRWNLEVSAAFMGPLHLCEIAVRNGIANAIDAVHGSDWPWTEGFIRSLPEGQGYNAKRDLQECAQRRRTAGQVIVDLKFIFWERMLASRFRRSIWRHHFPTVFPGYDTTLSINDARAACRDDLEHVRLFRNRIAHHEPVFTRDLQGDLKRISRLVRWRNPVAAAWLTKIETATPLIERQP